METEISDKIRLIISVPDMTFSELEDFRMSLNEKTETFVTNCTLKVIEKTKDIIILEAHKK